MLSIRKTSDTEFKREYLYSMTFDPTMLSRINTALGAVGFKYNAKDKIDLDYLNLSAVFPDKTSDVETFFWKGENRYVVKTPCSSGESDFIFFDDSDNNGSVIFTILYNESSFLHDNYSYIGNIKINEYDVDKKNIIRTAILYDCHVTGINHGTRKKDSQEISYITLHITWDASRVWEYFRRVM